MEQIHPFTWNKRIHVRRFASYKCHYGDVIIGTIASQITSLTIVYSTVYSDADQRKHQSFVSLAFVRGIHRGPVNSPHKCTVTRKMFPFDDVIMLTYHTRILETIYLMLFVNSQTHKDAHRQWRIGAIRNNATLKMKWQSEIAYLPKFPKIMTNLLVMMISMLIIKKILIQNSYYDNTNNYDSFMKICVTFSCALVSLQ